MTKLSEKSDSPIRPEPEWTGSGWKHPYVIYIILMAFLFLCILGIGWLAWTQGWIPNRGISS